MNDYFTGWADIVFLQALDNAASTNYEQTKAQTSPINITSPKHIHYYIMNHEM